MSDTAPDAAHTVLTGSHLRLEPLARTHVPGLLAAARQDLTLYQWSTIPDGVTEMAQYVDTAIAWREAGTALPFASVRIADSAVIGSTRFFPIERWAWPAGHPHAQRAAPDGCESVSAALQQAGRQG
jgi:N-acetyltransferase